MSTPERVETGKPYHDDDWPHGLRCARCHRVLNEGDRYSEQLDAFVDDVPLLLIVCVACAMGLAPA